MRIAFVDGQSVKGISIASQGHRANLPDLEQGSTAAGPILGVEEWPTRRSTGRQNKVSKKAGIGRSAAHDRHHTLSTRRPKSGIGLMCKRDAWKHLRSE